MSSRELIAIVATLVGLGAIVGGLVAVNNSGDDAADDVTAANSLSNGSSDAVTTSTAAATSTTTTTTAAATETSTSTSSTTTAAPTTTTTPGVFTSIFEVSVGDCFNNPAADEVSGITVVPCAAPHDNEIYALFDIESATLPTQQVMLEGCFDRFEEAIGAPYADSIYDFGAYFPGAVGFADGDREVICYAFTYTGDLNVVGEQIVGTVIGSGR